MSKLPMLFLSACMGLALSAQATKTPPTAKPGVTPVAPVAVAVAPEDELLAIKAVPYHPTLIRDPFSAPSDIESSKQGDLVDDVGIKGWVVSGGKFLAVVTNSRGNIRQLPVGYKFRDGEIVAINDKAVTFHQWDISSTNRSVFRTVVKPFKREEGKR